MLKLIANDIEGSIPYVLGFYLIRSLFLNLNHEKTTKLHKNTGEVGGIGEDDEVPNYF